MHGMDALSTSTRHTTSRRTPIHALLLNNLIHFYIDWIHSDEVHFKFWGTQKYWHCYQYLIALKLSGSSDKFLTDDFYPMIFSKKNLPVEKKTQLRKSILSSIHP